MRSYADWHQQTKRFSTVNCQSLLQRKRRPCWPALALPAAFSRSQTLSLYICRKERETTKERPLMAAICSNNRLNSMGMMPCACPYSNQSPCMVQVFPDPVCPYAKIVAWQPFSAFSMRWSTSQVEQTSACDAASSKMQSKLNFRWLPPQETYTYPLDLFPRMQLFVQPDWTSLLRKGRMRMPALILLLILQFYLGTGGKVLEGGRAGGSGDAQWEGCQGLRYNSVMYCGCEGKKRARLQRPSESVDSPFQVRLIKMLGLHSIILDKFVFRRKKSTYDIANIKGTTCLYLDGMRYQPPDYYRSEVAIIEKEGHSVPVVRLFPIRIEEGERVPCIVYAHGNSSDLGDSLRFITAMTGKYKAEYVAFDFTGYGESRVSSVGEEVICGDLEMVLAWLGRPLDEIILWGFSLGTYPVTVAAARLGVKASILQCPIGSLSCMFYDEYERDIKFKEDHFANIDYISSITGRILLMHSIADEIIPVEQARLLYNKYVAARGDKLIEFIQVEKIKHNSFHKYIAALNNNQLQKEVLAFLQINQNEIEYSRKEGEGVLHPDLVLKRKEISIAELPQEFEQQDYQLLETEQKSREGSGRSSPSPQGWLCYRK